jgi:hypothetical protein
MPVSGVRRAVLGKGEVAGDGPEDFVGEFQFFDFTLKLGDSALLLLLRLTRLLWGMLRQDSVPPVAGVTRIRSITQRDDSERWAGSASCFEMMLSQSWVPTGGDVADFAPFRLDRRG